MCRRSKILCRHDDFIKQDLSLRLKTAQQTELKAILQEAAVKIRKMQKTETDSGRKSVLETIGSRRTPARRKRRSAWSWWTWPKSSVSMTLRYWTPGDVAGPGSRGEFRHQGPTAYTYASPRTGDPAFVSTYNQVVPKSFRIANRIDLVPKLPFPRSTAMWTRLLI